MKVKTLIKQFGGKCYYCGKSVGSDGNIEHLLPSSNGGKRGCNLRLTHTKCNWKRGKIYNLIDNIYYWIVNRQRRGRALSQLDYINKNLSIQDGPWTKSYLKEMQFVLKNPNFLQTAMYVANAFQER